jgi:hypothetical protein
VPKNSGLLAVWKISWDRNNEGPKKVWNCFIMDKGQENPDFNLLVVWLLKWAFFFCKNQPFGRIFRLLFSTFSYITENSFGIHIQICH